MPWTIGGVSSSGFFELFDFSPICLTSKSFLLAFSFSQKQPFLVFLEYIPTKASYEFAKISYLHSDLLE